MKKALFAIIALILALGLALPMGMPAAAVSTIPHLEVDKSVSSPSVVVGKPVTVTLTITGAGSAIVERGSLDVILIIDRSGSMAWDGLPTRLSRAKAAAKAFIDILDSTCDRVGLVSFADSATLDIGLTDDFTSVKSAIDALSPLGSTNMGDAIYAANDEFDANGRADALRAEILLTDGLPNQPNGTGSGFDELDAAYARAEAQAAHDAGITLYTIGLGADISYYFLDDLPASEHNYNSLDPAGDPYNYDGLAYIGGGKFYYAPTGSDLQAIFEALAYHLITIAGQNVVLTEVLPDGVNYVPGSIVPPPDSISTDPVTGKTTLIWNNLGDLSIGDPPITITFDVIFDEPGYQPVDDPATNVTYDDYLGDPQTEYFIDPYITVNPPDNTAPVANDDNATTNEDTPVNIDVLANDTDVDTGDTLTVTSVTDPTNGSVVIEADNTVTYAPDANYNGPDNFDYTISDCNGGADTATVSITVDPVNDAPVADDQSVTTNEDTAKAITLTATDADGDPLTYSIVAPPSNGDLTGLLPDVTYTPDADYNGSDSFTFKANDGTDDSNTATVSITVDPVNDAPVANDDNATTNEDTPVNIDVLANDTDVDTGDTLTVTSVTDPTNGSVVIEADNTVTYAPDANYNGPDNFDYTISDGNGGADTATVTVNVSARRIGGGGGGGSITYYFTVDFEGKITKEPMSSAGRLLNPLEAPSPDGMHLLEMAKGTKTVDDQGKIVKLIEIREAEAPSLTANTVIVGDAYDFTPSDITFDQPIRLTLGYDNLPEDVASITLAYYTATTGWTELKPEGGVVAGEGKLTAPVDHFTIFAILAELNPPPPPPPSPPPPAPAAFKVDNLQITPSQSKLWEPVAFVVKTGEEVAISAYVTNYGGQEDKYTAILKVNGVTQATQEIILGSGQGQQVSFTLTENEPGIYTVEIGGLSGEFVTSLWTNWWLMGGILAGLLLIGWLAWYYGYYRRR